MEVLVSIKGGDYQERRLEGNAIPMFDSHQAPPRDLPLEPKTKQSIGVQQPGRVNLESNVCSRCNVNYHHDHHLV